LKIKDEGLLFQKILRTECIIMQPKMKHAKKENNNFGMFHFRREIQSLIFLRKILCQKLTCDNIYLKHC